MRILMIFILWSFQASLGIGSVVVLHGTSSAGKSSIALELQKILLGKWSIVAFDDFLGSVLLEKAKACGLIVQGMSELEHQKIIAAHIPELFARFDESSWSQIKICMYSFVQQQVSLGENVILDTVLSKNEFDNSSDFLTLLSDVPLFISLIYCSPFHLVEHTNARNDCGELTQVRNLDRVLQMFCEVYIPALNFPSLGVDTLTESDFVNQQIKEQFACSLGIGVIPAYGAYDCVVNAGLMSSRACSFDIYQNFLSKKCSILNK